MSRPVQVEQIFDDGSHPAIPGQLFGDGPAGFDPAPVPGPSCRVCAGVPAPSSDRCPRCVSAGWEAPRLLEVGS